ncbi:MAG: SIMPL domain-containing protein [Bacteroidia bacterium]|nr:SIMPL domain-containing protein [Bacteroidia bacterium]
MNTKLSIFNLAFLLMASVVQAQISGNSVYGQNYSQTSGNIQTIDKLYLTDSTFIIQARVAMNVIADSYVATFGVDEQAKSLDDCNDNIEKRINSFISDLSKLKIAKADIYTDMTTQNKIYDYKVNDRVAEQYLKGFELKKNVIIKFINIKDLDKMVTSASAWQIYDLVKVDYNVTDMNKIYTQLFQAGTEIINQKKGLYVGATNATLAPASEIYGEEFYSLSPSQLYKNYTAYESSDVYNNEYSNYTKKNLSKSTTFYYDKMNYSGFDKVINPIVTEPATEFVLILQIKYLTEKHKK